MGVYGREQGEWFEFDVTRQFLELDTSEEYREGFAEYEIVQLHLTARYEPVPELIALGAGDKWCEDRVQVPEFEAFIRDLEVCRQLSGRRPASVSVLVDLI